MHPVEPKNAKTHALFALAVTIIGSLGFALAFHEPEARASTGVSAVGADSFRANDDSVASTVAASLVGAHDVYDALDLDP
ncbi:MAG TPA: hypothetical protein VGO62_16030 [Myxococcota bacterium]|jgi:hypothetical protein